MDLNMPKTISDFVPEVSLYYKLQDVEKAMDAIIMRKRLELHENMTAPIKVLLHMILKTFLYWFFFFFRRKKLYGS